ncbi:MAG: transketolase [Actinomycetota bacterium]|nr:transketolase [Actinomycetota bacterium]
MSDKRDNLDTLCVNTIRALSIDAIEKAKSGHPGAPLGLAPVGYTLWTRFLCHNPKNPNWLGRDRFILSAGHASMLLYSLLYLTGYDISLEQIKNFRQLGSVTPGHPECGVVPGVEVTTGPLGQGISNGVGMALARELIAARFNREPYNLCDYYVYVIASDGDMMEGVASEASSLAGHLGLGKLVCLYDDNKVTIEGETSLSFTEDVSARFKAYGWHVLKVDDANDIQAVEEGIRQAREEKERPSLVIIQSHLAYGCPNLEDSAEAHGAPLGEKEACLTKKNLCFPEDKEFFVPGEVLKHMRNAIEQGKRAEEEWNEMFSSYKREYPELAREWERVMSGKLPPNWKASLPSFAPEGKMATRSASGKALQALSETIPELIGGSADLGPSNKTLIKNAESVKKGHFEGRNIHFGVREHGMAAILNGMARHGGMIPYGGTFLVFSDYMRPAIRLAAMMQAHVIYIFTHDSLAVGEDGPTHQPVEQLMSLRAIPGLTVIRPADANETVVAWEVALEAKSPVALVLSRQDLPILDRSSLAPAQELKRGAYIISDSDGLPQLILVGSGSEVSLLLEAKQKLFDLGVNARVISMPSWELFESQEEEYRAEIFPPEVRARLAVEASVAQGWWKYVGEKGNIISVERFGMSAPAKAAMSEAGFTVENVVNKAMELISGEKQKT